MKVSEPLNKYDLENMADFTSLTSLDISFCVMRDPQKDRLMNYFVNKPNPSLTLTLTPIEGSFDELFCKAKTVENVEG